MSKEKPVIEQLRWGNPKAKSPIEDTSEHSIVYDVLEEEAQYSFYINGAKSPGFLILNKWNWANVWDQHALVMNRVGLIALFKKEKDALARMKTIVETANFPCIVYIQSKRKKLQLFAENKIQRKEIPSRPDIVTRTFNIPEWDTLEVKA